MKLLLHACCAWCLAKCLPGLALDGIQAADATVFWYNPNIHPLIEYRRRRKALRMLCERASLALADGHLAGEEREGYGLVAFCRAVHGRETVPERCAACYAMRMRRTAKAAKEGGFDAFTTTLLTSLQQNHALLKAAGEAAAEEFGVAFLYRDGRGNEADARLTKWLYKQSYCGCVFSEYDRYHATTKHLWPPPDGNSGPSPSGFPSLHRPFVAGCPDTSHKESTP
ncbi:MAG: epoxyqueuosine reductase QueH [Kiritimatiellae bacterium]|nr:epoxyqueuosine reductase QueH [Kiritimatiellia bacterium]